MRCLSKQIFLMILPCTMALISISCAKLGLEENHSIVRSLTNKNYTGKKFYLGWGAAAARDPQYMANQVVQDVKNTHNNFSATSGGNYEGIVALGAKAQGELIKEHWRNLKAKIKENDMYVQYSSGHGLPAGLAVGLYYKTIRDSVLALNAKETIVFTMACYSGGLINSFSEKQDEINARAKQGKTLFVMSSSSVRTESAERPDSQGSVFGYSLWQAMQGKADGAVDGVQDGFVDLSEIEAYTTALTYQMSSRLGAPHIPQTIGVNYEKLIINAIPRGSYGSSGTDELSDTELNAQFQQYEQLSSSETVQELK